MSDVHRGRSSEGTESGAARPSFAGDPGPPPSESGGRVVSLGPGFLFGLATLVAVLVLVWLLNAGRLSLPGGGAPDASASLWLVFLTGLSVGGLSCLAVQGGLLAAMIAQRELRAREEGEPQGPPDARGSAGDRLAPVLLFLGSKLAAYTALGALLGYFGSKIPLALQGWLIIAVGVFMLIVVLQMFDVHPFFRRFAFQPPKAVQRYLRQRSKRGDKLGPLALGALTVFIPCGTTLAMELLAIASNSPLRGAQIMFAFTLGTLPLFLAMGVAASQLGQRAYRVFRPVAALAIVLVALLSIRSGARLLGVNPSWGSGGSVGQAEIRGEAPADLASGIAPSGAALPAAPGASAADASPRMSQPIQEATIQVATSAYTPGRLQIKAGLPTRLSLVSEGARGCIRAFTIPALGIERMLPETGTEVLELPPAAPGTIDFMCSMGMYGGVIEVLQ